MQNIVLIISLFLVVSDYLSLFSSSGGDTANRRIGSTGLVHAGHIFRREFHSGRLRYSHPTARVWWFPVSAQNTVSYAARRGLSVPGRRIVRTATSFKPTRAVFALAASSWNRGKVMPGSPFIEFRRIFDLAGQQSLPVGLNGTALSYLRTGDRLKVTVFEPGW